MLFRLRKLKILRISKCIFLYFLYLLPNLPSIFTNQTNIYKLKCYSKNYYWGKDSETSLVSKILTSNNQEVKSGHNYAEYWMGTHESCPCDIIVNQKENKIISLLNYLGDHPLTYLFKVLSIEKPLSIQMHPDKEMAVKLNKDFPDLYKDPNPKPELFISITEDFELIYGLKTLTEAHKTINKYKNFFKFNEAKIFEESPTLINYKNFIDKLMVLGQYECEEIIDSILNQNLYITHNNRKTDDEDIKLVNILYNYFGKDSGILFALFMNYIHKKKGESIFIGPNIPHAYIKGDCFEVMSDSDNVIRLGLTPKSKDVNTFKSILDKSFGNMIHDISDIESINEHIMKKGDGEITIFKKKGIDDFYLKLINTTNNVNNIIIPPRSIIFNFEGTVNFNFYDNTGNRRILMKPLEGYFVENQIIKGNFIIQDKNKKSKILICSSIR